MIALLWAQLKEAWPINRVVALLTVFVFTPAAAAVSAWLALHFPGLPSIPADQLQGVFAAGALAALTIGYKWLDGWQKHESRLNEPDPAPPGDPASDLSEAAGNEDIDPSDNVPDEQIEPDPNQPPS